MSEQPIAEDESDSEPEERSDSEYIGEMLAERYQISEHLGGGGMGEVYRGEHVMMKKPVAVKILRSEVVHHENVVERFRREAQAAANIDHPNICSAMDFGRTDTGDFFLVMELLDGETLGDHLEREGPQPVERAVEIGVEIAAALEAAHESGVVHRDLKPDNVMLVAESDDPRWLNVLDFGVSRVQMDDETPSITKTGAIFGTPDYMAPEQAAGKSVDHRADLYALGVILYEIVSGRPPFEADQSIKVMTAHLERAPEPLSEVLAASDEPFEELIFALLAKEPDQRPQSATEVRERLQSIDRHPDRGEQTAPTTSTASNADDSRTIEIRVPSTEKLEEMATTARGRLRRVAGKLTDAVGLARLNKSMLKLLAGLIVVLGVSGGVVVGYTASRMLSGPSAKDTEALAEQREAYLERQEAIAAAEALEDGDAERAVEQLEAIREDGSANAHLDYLLGRAHAAEARWAQALEHYERALERNEVYGLEAELVRDLIEGLNASTSDIADRAESMLSSRISEAGVRAAVAELAWSANRARTRQAAFEVLESNDVMDELEPWQRASVRLRHAQGCEAHREQIERLADFGEPRGLEVLRIFDDIPREGCGSFDNEDCYGCIRSDLADAIEELEASE